MRPDLTLDAAPDSAPAAGIDPSLAPASPAAILLLDHLHRPILLATTADARAFLRKRLTPPSPDTHSPGSPRTDLSAITARVEITRVASALEADLAFLAIARHAMPATWPALTQRWRAWFVRLDPDAPAPTWSKTNLSDAADADPRTLVGPLTTKDAAGRFGESLDAIFDLCRFPRELTLAPRGTPCAYKEMGACPAPCDGSEPMPAFRARVRDALHTLRLDPALRLPTLDAEMRRAAQAQDYETAARLKGRLDRLAQIATPTTRHARPLDTFRCLAILTSGRLGWARAWLIDAWTCTPITDVNAADIKAAAATLAATIAQRHVDQPEASERRPLDPVHLGIVARHLLAPPAKRRGGFIRLDEPIDLQTLQHLIRSAAKADTTDIEEFDRATLDELAPHT